MIEIPLLPHGQCLLWGSALLWLHLIADAVIATAYYSIPVTLGTLVWKRKDLPLSRIFWLFGLFILGCGTGHLLEIWTIWWPNYRAEGVVKAVMATVSVVTALLLWKFLPIALALPSRQESEALNRALEKEIGVRERAESALRQSEERFRAFMDHSSLVSFIKNELGEYVDLNTYAPVTLQLLGGRDWRRKMDFDFWPQRAVVLGGHDESGIAQDEAPEGQQMVPSDADDRHWVVYEFPFLDRDGRQLQGGMAIDDTARRQAERALRMAHEELERRVEERTAELTVINTELKRSEKELQRQAALLDLTADPIFVWDLDNGIRHWNQGAETVYGYSADMAKNRSSHELLRSIMPLTPRELSETLQVMRSVERETDAYDAGRLSADG